MSEYKCKHCNKVLDKRGSYCSNDCKIQDHTKKSISSIHIKDPLKIMSSTDYSECDIWTGTMRGNHPTTKDPITNKEIYIRKYLYEKYIGEIPKGMYVKTICNNPRCVRLEHLVLQSGTCKINCVYCGKDFVGYNNSKYCSLKCNFKYNTDKISDPNGCWLWKGSVDFKGYGAININGKFIKTHRYSYELHKGPIPKGLHILHSCDNPVCVNPDHLRVGTNAENIQDKIDRNRQAKGETSGTSKLNNEQVKAIYSSREYASSLARKYHVSPTTIDAIRNDIAWVHITNNLIKPESIEHGGLTLNEDQVKEIYTSKLCTKELANKYNVSTRTIRSIKCQEYWKHVTTGLINPERVRYGNSKLTEEDVKEIYLSKLSIAELMLQYKTSRSNIRWIRAGKTWKNVTKDLVRPE